MLTNILSDIGKGNLENGNIFYGGILSYWQPFRDFCICDGFKSQ